MNKPTTIDLEALAGVTGGATQPSEGKCPFPWRDIWDWIRGGGKPQPQPQPQPDTQGGAS
jgi:hypothetical protein